MFSKYHERLNITANARKAHDLAYNSRKSGSKVMTASSQPAGRDNTARLHKSLLQTLHPSTSSLSCAVKEAQISSFEFSSLTLWQPRLVLALPLSSEKSWNV